MPLKVTLSWSDPQLIEGHLVLKWFVNRTQLGSYTAPESALSSGSVTRNVMLPPAIMPFQDAVFSVQGEFITEDQIYDLDVHDVFVPLDWRRTFIVGIGREPPLQMETATRGVQNIAFTGLIQSLRLERFIDEPMTNRELSTMVVEVSPADLPTNPLELMGFDILIIPAENVGALEPDHLEALTTWVRAGGSLGVLVDSPLEQTLVDFLNSLTGDSNVDVAYLRTDERLLLPVEGEPQGVDRHRCELGRLVVSRGAVDYNSDEWLRAILFLWKVRQQRIDEWEQGKPWEVKPPPDHYGYIRPLTFQPNREFAAPWITRLLLPQSIEGIPLVTVCGILGLFLLIIAPGDYYLLGWLKRRRWTWVLFPAMSLLFTAMMIKLAEAHRGSANLERSITIVDLSTEGTPLRSTRIDLLYPAFSRQVTDEQSSAWMVPVDPDTSQSNAFPERSRILPEYDPAWSYAGSLPGRHVVQRDVRQWSPRLSRTTALGSTSHAAETPLSNFDWTQVTWERTTQPDEMAALRQSLRDLDSTVDVDLLRSEIKGSGQSHLPVRQQVFNFAKYVTYIGDSHLFTLLSQLSPSGAGHWDDLAMQDWTENQSVFIAMTEADEGHYVVYRKLLTRED